MAVVIPIPRQNQEAALSWSVLLDDVLYDLVLTWGERAQCWYLDLAVASPAQVLVRGMRLGLVHDLWERFRPRLGQALPSGSLRVYSRDATNTFAPGFAELGPGGRCFLVYHSAQEIVLEASGSTLSAVEVVE